MTECDFLIVGAGIAGTSCGHFLSREHSVIVLEMEGQPGYHTTGRSIAVYTEAYGPKTIRALAISGFEFFTATCRPIASRALPAWTSFRRIYRGGLRHPARGSLPTSPTQACSERHQNCFFGASSARWRTAPTRTP